jgi:integrator complex subunit 11
MFDCGMHMGFQDARRFPDFSLLSASGDFDGVLDAVIVSHFHLDHCGALPFFTEVRGFRGPVIMTHPTKAICPVLLEDFRRLVVERRGGASRRGQRARSGANDNENDEAGGDEEAEAGEAEGGPRDFFTSEHIAACMKKVRAVSVNETLTLAPDFEVRAYYAGHVLGAAMFHVRVGAQSVVYTGDFNTTPDRHLGAAWIDRCEPDLLITESTYATTVRDSRRAREQGFLRRVKECVDRGGKVLIPVFALGRAQELCILVSWSESSLVRARVLTLARRSWTASGASSACARPSTSPRDSARGAPTTTSSSSGGPTSK